MITAARAIFADTWELRRSREKTDTKRCASEIKAIRTKMHDLVERLIAQSVKSADIAVEDRIEALEEDKLIFREEC